MSEKGTQSSPSTTSTSTATNKAEMGLQIEESLGAKATKIAQEKASQWLDHSWAVIQKLVLDTAARGLFHATIRFEDVVPQDPENQARLLKILGKQNLKGTFKNVGESSVDLNIMWGLDFL